MMLLLSMIAGWIIIGIASYCIGGYFLYHRFGGYGYCVFCKNGKRQ